jgi:prevent-host-death family protein
MEKINVSTLRENLAAYINKAKNGQEITITSHGHELAKLVPAGKKLENARSKLKKLGKTAVMEDILSPLDEDWDALK